MTRQRALQILIEHACANCAGSGCGIRSLPSESSRKEVKEAIQKIWKSAYSYPLDDNFFIGRGLYE